MAQYKLFITMPVEGELFSYGLYVRKEPVYILFTARNDEHAKQKIPSEVAKYNITSEGVMHKATVDSPFNLKRILEERIR